MAWFNPLRTSISSGLLKTSSTLGSAESHMPTACNMRTMQEQSSEVASMCVLADAWSCVHVSSTLMLVFSVVCLDFNDGCSLSKCSAGPKQHRVAGSKSQSANDMPRWLHVSIHQLWPQPRSFMSEEFGAQSGTHHSPAPQDRNVIEVIVPHAVLNSPRALA